MPRSTRIVRHTLLPLLVTTLAACGGAPAAPDRPVAAVAQTVVPATVLPSPTASPTAVPSPTTAPTTVPTPTTEPTAISTPTAEPTAIPTPTAEPTTISTPTPQLDVSAATGEGSFARGNIRKRPWMVMIDNFPDAYPQSGLNKAAVVFEGLAEYGVTRFIGIFQDGVTEDVGEIGPVRSTRLYFAQWAMGFHPVYAYAGGSPDGVKLAETTDQFIKFDALRQPKYTWRDRKRVAPHNLYTNSSMLRAFAEDRQVTVFSDASVGFLFDNVTPASPTAVNGLDYFFLDRSSRAGFTYDPATNGYYRSMRGQPHIDRVTGQRLWTRNVVVMQVTESVRPGDDKRRIDQDVIGSGPARLFNAGRSVDITWRKTDAAAPLRFYDADDNEVVFNTGPVWIAAIPTLNRLTQR